MESSFSTILSLFDINNEYLSLISIFYKLQPSDEVYEKQKLRTSLLSISSSPKRRLDNDKIKSRDNINIVNSECYGHKLVIFSGGTAFNSVVKILSKSLSTKVKVAVDQNRHFFCAKTKDIGKKLRVHCHIISYIRYLFLPSTLSNFKFLEPKLKPL